ncbi:hypothetical protein [Gracilibacillus massiliensis]|uniref:hypothetical protein n=1 Tax=Gracilibacillus massiliensis TaxID=1564956 RepID=UPI00071DAA32|nr:hypothetical protein [Gracilibacillus massiliensis]
MEKFIRRTLIIVALLLLVPDILAGIKGVLPVSIPDNLEAKINASEAIHYEIDKEAQVGADHIYFKHLIISDEATILIYKIKKGEQGWSFSESAMYLTTAEGKSYEFNGGSSSHWGYISSSVSGFEKIPIDTESITIEYEWYDRSFQVDVPIDNGGTIE